jgi:molybdopterin-guanine dinucleotide biosynthesis protein
MTEGDATDVRVYMLEDVFSTGRTPDATYNARLSEGLEARLRAYLRATSNAVTVFGASKSGKTSLVERVLPESQACWLQGSDIVTIDDFWGLIAERLEIANTVAQQEASETSKSDGVEGGVALPGRVAHMKFDSTDKSSTTSATTKTMTLRPEAQAKALLAKLKMPIVIDDFHHVHIDIRQRIARSIKAIIRHTCVILIAIPSQAFDSVKNEQDLTGRIKSLPVPPWKEHELAEIALQGFQLLNLTDPHGQLSADLARYSFGSPHIMQELCHTVLMDGFGILETGAPRTLDIPENLDDLLERAAEASEPPFFEKLIEGKATKGNKRKQIILKAGSRRTDIYGIVIEALRNITPPMAHSVREIQAEVNNLTGEVIKKGRITNVLKGLDSIASKHKGASDPVLSYQDEKLYIEDSVFAFYLNHGPWKEKLTNSGLY